MEQLSNLDQVDHLSTNRTLRDVDYFYFKDLLFFFSTSVEVGLRDQPDHRYQGEEKYFLQATGATSKEGEWGGTWGTLKIYVY